jgi:hypothetical protein
MPLNISIDVDGTLLDENEEVDPQARKLIEQLKAEGHSLQLWSTGGADYALRIATERGLADLFDSFGTKPDVAIDDIPEAVHPVATLKVDKSFVLVNVIAALKSKIENCVESALCPSPELVKYIGKIQKQSEDAKRVYQMILRENVPFHPIPFFGNVSTARIITVGLNPSSGEFEPWRCWPEKLDAQELTSRLVGYFRHTHPRPHPWFAELQEALSIINCPYSLAAAHIDVSPWPTLAPSTLKKRKNSVKMLDLYNKMIEAEVRQLPNFIKKCKNLKLVLIIGKTGWIDFVKHAIEGKFAGEIEVVEKNDLPRWISNNKKRIREIIDWPPNVC